MTNREEGRRNCIGGPTSGGLNVTDQKLHSLTENQLRALYNSAPDYLKSLLDRKRVLEEGIVWEMSIPQRAAPKAF
jgi:hypothetical protein